MKWIHASSSVLALAALVVSLQQGSSKGVVEAEGFRVVQGGKKLWEVTPIDGGTKMTFFVEGRERLRFITQGDVVAWHLESEDKEKAVDVVLSKEMFAESIGFAAGKRNVVMSRRIVTEKGELRAHNGVEIGGTMLDLVADGSSAALSATCGFNKTALRVGMKNQNLSLVGSVPDDLNVDLQVGGRPFEMSCRGSIAEGFDAFLKRDKKEWAWSSK